MIQRIFTSMKLAFSWKWSPGKCSFTFLEISAKASVPDCYGVRMTKLSSWLERQLNITNWEKKWDIQSSKKENPQPRMQPLKYDLESNLTNTDDLGPRSVADQTTEWKSSMKGCTMRLFGQASSVPCCKELNCTAAMLYKYYRTWRFQSEAGLPNPCPYCFMSKPKESQDRV